MAAGGGMDSSMVGMKGGANMGTSEDLTKGQIVEGRYQVIRLIGSGSFAHIYEATHLGLQSKHALKILDAELAADADLRNRFLAEGRIQAQLRHPNIVSVTDIVTQPYPGLVMEHVEGWTMDQYMEHYGPPKTPAGVLTVFGPILDGVAAAHRAGVVHRDLKPENIIMGTGANGELRPMVTDFGIAKVLDEATVNTGKKKTEAGVRMGTLLYMSPEQVRGAKNLDARSDVFALGAILYELVTGRIAFDAPSEFDTMRNIVDGTFEPPERAVGKLHPVFAACIRKALAIDPDERFRDCAEFKTAMDGVDNPTIPLPAGPTRSAAVTGPPQPADVPPPAFPTPVQRISQPNTAPSDEEDWELNKLAGKLPPKPTIQPWVPTVVNLFCLCGIGQLLNGQVGKGVVILIVHLILSAIGFPFPTWIIAPLDAYLIAKKRRGGKWVGKWEWF